MRFFDLLRLAVRNSLRNGLKALLCAGAVCIGICSVCTVRGVGVYAEQSISAELSQLGVGGMMLYSEEGVAVSDEAVAAVAAVDGVAASTPFLYQRGKAKLHRLCFSVALCGVEPDIAEVFSFELLHGRLLGKGERGKNAWAAVIDDETALAAYGRTNVVGKTLELTVDGASGAFEIVGVVRSQKAGLEALIGGKLPCIAYLPAAAMRAFCGSSSEMIAVAPQADADQEALAQRLTRAAERAWGVAASVENLDRYAGSVRRIMQTVSLLISGIAAISILVGGIGVMNAMVAVVDERVGEIGVWLALGARRRSIAGCYLLEALLICLCGGLAGVALSCGLLAGLRVALGLALSLRVGEMLLGVMGAALCGMLFGLLPALHAARMDPIDAIRSD